MKFILNLFKDYFYQLLFFFVFNLLLCSFTSASLISLRNSAFSFSEVNPIAAIKDSWSFFSYFSMCSVSIPRSSDLLLIFLAPSTVFFVPSLYLSVLLPSRFKLLCTEVPLLFGDFLLWLFPPWAFLKS